MITRRAEIQTGGGGSGGGGGGGPVPSADGDRVRTLLGLAHRQFGLGRYREALQTCEALYGVEAGRAEALLLLGEVHFRMRMFRECIFYNQECIRVDPHYSEAYSNLGNALRELGDVQGAVPYYLQAIRLKPRFCGAYNNLGSAYMQLGQYQWAIDMYEVALVLEPALVEARSNLGNLYKAQGRNEAAKRCHWEAIRLKPDFAIAWSNLAGILKEERQLPAAVAYYREAIRLCPTFVDALSNLGNALKEQGKVREAMECYRKSIALRPDFAIAHGNIASCYYDLGELDLAIRTFEHAIRLDPNFPDAYNNLGNAQRDRGQLDEAIASYRTALRLQPNHSHAYNNLGNAMKDKNLVPEAIDCYRRAIHLLPRFAAAHSNLGTILKEQGNLEQALEHYRRAISIDPRFADAHSNMGNAYKDLGQLNEAIRCYRTAIEIKPTFADAYANLASAYKDAGHVEQAIEHYRRALELKPSSPDAFANLVHSLVFICDWSTREQDFRRLKALLRDQLAEPTKLPSVQPFHALVYPLSCAEMLALARRYAQKAQSNAALAAAPALPHAARRAGDRLRVGYVSSDFRDHPLSHLMQSVFRFHDAARVEVHLYALSPHDGSEWRDRVEAAAEHFHALGDLDSGAAARLIRGHGIHVLVNLNGYTKGARNEIFALRPAPLQLSYMGFCGTMGADFIDYLVADERVVPAAQREYYSEALLLMPHSYFVNDHRQSARYALEERQASRRADYGVREDAFVFANFNQLYKLDPETFATWCAVLKRVPNAVLWLLRFPPAGERNIREQARRHGLREEQLHFTDVSEKEEHIRRGHLADLFLDTPCCNAHTTACDILWGGTPMLTLPAEKMATRVAASLLHAAGAAFAEELVVGSLADYEERAVALATDAPRLRRLREGLRRARDTSPAFDTRRWVRNFEAGLEEVWDRHAAGRPPADVRVGDVGGPTPDGDAAR